MIRVTLLALILLLPLAAAEGGPWTVRTADDGTTYAVSEDVRLQWPADIGPMTRVDVMVGGIHLFDLGLQMEDALGARQPTTWETGADWFIVGAPRPLLPELPEMWLGVHDALTLDGRVQCEVPPEPVTPVGPCIATFPAGSILTVFPDGNTIRVQLPVQEDGATGPTLSWYGFNPQPEPPALLKQGGIHSVDETSFRFTGADIQVTVEGIGG